MRYSSWAPTAATMVKTGHQSQQRALCVPFVNSTPPGVLTKCRAICPKVIMHPARRGRKALVSVRDGVQYLQRYHKDKEQQCDSHKKIAAKIEGMRVRRLQPPEPRAAPLRTPFSTKSRERRLLRLGEERARRILERGGVLRLGLAHDSGRGSLHGILGKGVCSERDK
jgi:hypothetical protein